MSLTPESWIPQISTPLASLEALLSYQAQANGLSLDDLASCLGAKDEGLPPPWALRDLLPALNLLLSLAQQGQSQPVKVCIYGDYDVDGLTASKVMADACTDLGLTWDVVIPDRLTEGYGINRDKALEIAKRRPDLLITVDCGSTAHEELGIICEAGVKVLITDHHELPADLPPCNAILNPKREDETYSFRDLAGVGVAYSLIRALTLLLLSYGNQEKLPPSLLAQIEWGRDLGPLQELQDLLEALGPSICKKWGEGLDRPQHYYSLVALGTLADAMPLVGENRHYVKKGLQVLPKDLPLGLRALYEEAIQNSYRQPAIPVNEEFLAFQILPCLNAAGRMGQVEVASSLLFATDPLSAKNFAQDLLQLNAQRKEIQNEIFSEVQEKLAQGPYPDLIARRLPLLLWSKSWHPGVAGIVASKVTDQYHLPALIFGYSQGTYKGSARSGDQHPGFSFYEALCPLAPTYATSFGGHAQAAGISVPEDKIGAFFQAFVERCAQMPAFQTGGSHEGLFQIFAGQVAKNMPSSSARLGSSSLLEKSETESLIAQDLAFPILSKSYLCQVPHQLLTLELMEDLDAMRPFGTGFQEPSFLLGPFLIQEVKTMGKKREHVKFRLAKVPELGAPPYDHDLEALAFFQPDLADSFAPGDYVDVLASLTPCYAEYGRRKQLNPVPLTHFDLHLVGMRWLGSSAIEEPFYQKLGDIESDWQEGDSLEVLCERYSLSPSYFQLDWPGLTAAFQALQAVTQSTQGKETLEKDSSVRKSQRSTAHPTAFCFDHTCQLVQRVLKNRGLSLSLFVLRRCFDTWEELGLGTLLTLHSGTEWTFGPSATFWVFHSCPQERKSVRSCPTWQRLMGDLETVKNRNRR